LVTGASGFIGAAACARLAQTHAVRGAVRRPGVDLPAGVEPAMVGGLAGDTDWTRALKGVQVVVHAAARVHLMRDAAQDPLTEYRRVNVAGTMQLARQAAEAGVGRFVFLSSIKVNGEETMTGSPYTADEEPAPIDPYGMSKHEAEQGLFQLASNSGMQVVAIRPVLVYGPGVKANFQTMMRWLQRGLPLPFGAIRNRRSLVALDNLVDGEDFSTTELLRRTATAMGTRGRLVPMPERLIWAAACLCGKPEVARRLCGSLQVDITKTRKLLNWSPPISPDDALRRAAADFLRQKHR
jgi:nucleoside-diphosphate-sugar epimerase